MQGISIYSCRYTIDAVMNGKKGPLLTVDGVVAVGENVTRSLAHDYACRSRCDREDKKIFGELGGSDGALVFIVLRGLRFRFPAHGPSTTNCPSPQRQSSQYVGLQTYIPRTLLVRLLLLWIFCKHRLWLVGFPSCEKCQECKYT